MKVHTETHTEDEHTNDGIANVVRDMMKNWRAVKQVTVHLEFTSRGDATKYETRHYSHDDPPMPGKLTVIPATDTRPAIHIHVEEVK